jgi:hypothetical protein
MYCYSANHDFVQTTASGRPDSCWSGLCSLYASSLSEYCVISFPSSPLRKMCVWPRIAGSWPPARHDRHNNATHATSIRNFICGSSWEKKILLLVCYYCVLQFTSVRDVRATCCAHGSLSCTASCLAPRTPILHAIRLRPSYQWTALGSVPWGWMPKPWRPEPHPEPDGVGHWLTAHGWRRQHGLTSSH